MIQNMPQYGQDIVAGLQKVGSDLYAFGSDLRELTGINVAVYGSAVAAALVTRYGVSALLRCGNRSVATERAEATAKQIIADLKANPDLTSRDLMPTLRKIDFKAKGEGIRQGTLSTIAAAAAFVLTARAAFLYFK